MNTVATSSSELLPGYEIAERIGSGGYGEVFRATAPGGVEKAVKTLYGYHDEELAARELKALERIKSVRHPFLISLDRFDVIDGRLIVVTELAERSLDECFEQYRHDGERGIPRDELLVYLSDAADALDYMHDEHSLQHLDVKPENLLILGGHVKVADFGLVKDVARPTLNSMVGGMTPTYAAPEMFDDRPGPRSDQYSLAIVYQEMLTGTLPFPGRTPAQLVAQHLQSPPRVSALPESDRQAVHRALAKDPADRFASCTEFVKALRQQGDVAKPDGNAAAGPQSKQESDCYDDDTREMANCVTESIVHQEPASGEAKPTPAGSPRSWGQTEQMGSSTGNAQSDASQPRAASVSASDPKMQPTPIAVSTEIIDVAIPPTQGTRDKIRPTLLIGLGGQGAAVLQMVREHRLTHDRGDALLNNVSMLAIDSDRTAIRDILNRVSDEDAPAIATQLIPLQRPQHYRDKTPAIQKWLSRRWLYNIPRSLETQGFRPLGRLALIDNAEAVVAAIDEQLAQLFGEQQSDSDSARLDGVGIPRIFILASTVGGTGSGIAIDVACAVRKLVRQRAEQTCEIVGVFGDSSQRGIECRNLALANTKALLVELNAISAGGNRGEGSSHQDNALFEQDDMPFDHVYYTSTFAGKSCLSVDHWVEQTANFIALDVLRESGEMLDACRTTAARNDADEDSSLPLRSLVVSPLQESREVVKRLAQERVCRLVVEYWRLAHDQVGSIDDRPESVRPPRVPNLSGGDSLDLVGADRPTDEQVISQRIDEAVQDKFGGGAESVFAVALGEALFRHLGKNEDDLLQENEMNLRRFLHRLAEQALEGMTAAIGYYAGADSDGEAISARCFKEVVECCESNPLLTLEDPQVSLVTTVSQRASHGYFDALMHKENRVQSDLSEHLRHAVREEIERLSQTDEGAGVVEKIADCDVDLSMILEEAAISPDDCGHLRHTLVVVPKNSADAELHKRVGSLLPQATVVHADVERPMLIREVAALSLAQVAARITKDRPDIDEAARRLHTRSDLTWAPLQTVVDERDVTCS